MIQTIIPYVINAPFFWLSMGLDAAIAAIVGAIIYDGDLSAAWKGLVSVILYGFIIFQVDFTRIENLFARFPDSVDMTRLGGVVTLVFVTGFWIFGIFIGVAASYLTRRKYRKVV